MKKTKQWILLATVGMVSILSVSGCGDKKIEPKPTPMVEDSEQQVPPVNKEHVFSTQQQALEKAKALEKQMQEAATRQQEAIDSQMQ